MSVLIKDMEMPKNCDNCEFHLEEDVAFEICHRCQITGKYIDKMDICSFPYDCPLAEEPERKTGRWIYGEDDSGQDGWTCSECGFFVPWYYDYYGLNNIDFIRDFHTCPHCDAKMLTYTGKKMEVEHDVG